MQEYIIFEDSVHAQVFLVQANTEDEAWKLYLERQWEYVEQSDGTYRHKTRHHNNLDDALGTYGIISHSDGSYSDVHGLEFSSLREVKFSYGIEEQTDGTYVSHGKACANLEQARRQVAGHHHVEIASCRINPLSLFQSLFVSRDKWDFALLDTADEIKDDIMTQHLWQATRYESLDQAEEAVAELRKALRLTSDPRERLKVLLETGRLLESLGQLPAAAKQYQQALRLATEFDNRGAIRYGLAEIYERLGQPSKALWHYKRVFLEDLDDEDGRKIAERVTALEQANRTTATA